MMMAPVAAHIPVLLTPLLATASPIDGIWVDGTFGAGGYTRGLLDAGAEGVIAIDRDPDVFDRARDWADTLGARLSLCPGRFGDLDAHARSAGHAKVQGVVLDIGVSSMQIDQPERGFSFQKDGPLDMRMGQSGVSAADLINDADEKLLADILFQYGEERASRRIAQAIVKAQQAAPIQTTGRLVEVIEAVIPRQKPGQTHPATRSFQALRIAVNDELGELARGLNAAERILAPGGMLAVVTFHSLEDRVVKRFMQKRCGQMANASRHAPQTGQPPATFERVTRKAIEADAAEIARNPRARSARLRIVRRTDAPASDGDLSDLGLPGLALEDLRP